MGTILVGGFSASLVVLVRQARALRLAKRSLASGEIGAAERLQRAREEVYRQGTGKWLLASAIAVQPLIPACLALIIYNGMQLPDGRLVNGKLVVHGRAQQLREWLQWQENRGIFTPIQGFK